MGNIYSNRVKQTPFGDQGIEIVERSGLVTQTLFVTP